MVHKLEFYKLMLFACPPLRFWQSKHRPLPDQLIWAGHHLVSDEQQRSERLSYST